MIAYLLCILGGLVLGVASLFTVGIVRASRMNPAGRHRESKVLAQGGRRAS